MGQSGPASFDLRASSLGGSGRGVTLDGAFLGWRDHDGPRRRPLEDIRTIDLDAEMAGDEPHARCDVGFADSNSVTVHLDNDKPEQIVRYRAFVATLLERLGPERRARILFREGSRPAKRLAMIIGAGSMLALSAGVFLFGLFNPETYTQPNEWMLVPLMLFFVVATGFGLWAAVKSGQKPFDPEDIPARALPGQWERRKKAPGAPV